MEEKYVEATVLMPEFSLKSKTNDGELAKQYFSSVHVENTEPTLLVRKLVLTKNLSLYSDYKLLRLCNGYGLFEQRFGIKLSTLDKVLTRFNDSLINNS